MSHVYRERHEIPIPEGAHINHFDARVYLMEESTRKRTVIGVATSESTMHLRPARMDSIRFSRMHMDQSMPI